MITAKETHLLKAKTQFLEMCQFVQQAVEDGARVDQVERGLFSQAMEVCRDLLEAFVASHGEGDEGESIEREGKTLRRLSKRHRKRYLSIFGELAIFRWVYGTREGQAIEWVPLDAALGLPAGENSYVLEDWQQSDRRKYARKPCSMPIDYAMGNRVFKDVARDISAGGVFIRTPAALSIGEEISLPFSVPTQKEPVTITGEIVRSVEDGIGVKFTAESNDLEAMIESL